jgi:thiol-disulfide isomerase/thioredoxin
MRSRRLALLVVGGGLLIALAAYVRPRLVAHQQVRGLLEAETLDLDLLADALEHRPDAPAVLLRLWNSGQFPHRRAVLEYVLGRPGMSPPIRELRTALVHEAALDPDQALREAALGTLSPASPTSEDPPGPPTATLPILGPQLQDADPELRFRALLQLGGVGHVGWTPVVLRLLEDPDVSVAIAADALLRRWSGRDSGLLFHHAPPRSGSGLVPREADPVTLELLAGARRSRPAWWASLPAQPYPVDALPAQPVTRRLVPDFTLPDLDGSPRRLSEFRGRRVLLNFWASWCTTCLTEFPVLAELQRRHPQDLAILGISLDSLREGPLARTNPPPTLEAELVEIRRTVRLIASRHRLNYPVLLDPENRVGRRFDGHELPTQVLLDTEGRVVRRFLGGRPLEVWERMLEAAQDPARTGR